MVPNEEVGGRASCLEVGAVCLRKLGAKAVPGTEGTYMSDCPPCRL